jgi:hypothetical protein
MRCTRPRQETWPGESGESLSQMACGSAMSTVAPGSDAMAGTVQPGPDVVMPIPRSGSGSEDQGRVYRFRARATSRSRILARFRRTDAGISTFHRDRSITPQTTVGERSSDVLLDPEDGQLLDGTAEYVTCGLPRAEIMTYLQQTYGLVFAADLSKRLSPVAASRSGARVSRPAAGARAPEADVVLLVLRHRVRKIMDQWYHWAR